MTDAEIDAEIRSSGLDPVLIRDRGRQIGEALKGLPIPSLAAEAAFSRLVARWKADDGGGDGAAAVIRAAEAVIDQLNSFNDKGHPEVHRALLSLQAAVGASFRARAAGGAAKPVHVLCLNTYQRDNLRWLLAACGVRYEDGEFTRAEPFPAADTGDWLAEIAAMLGGQRGLPNISLDVLRSTIIARIKVATDLAKAFDGSVPGGGTNS